MDGRTDGRTDGHPPLILLGRLLEVDLKTTGIPRCAANKIKVWASLHSGAGSPFFVKF